VVAIATAAPLQNSVLVYCASSAVDFLKKHVSLFSITSLKCFNTNIIYVHNFNSNNISCKWCLNRLPVGQCASVVLVRSARSTVEFLRQETPDFISLDLWPPINPHFNSIEYKTDLGLHAAAYKKPVHYMVQKQRLVKVQADFEKTIVNKAIDQWSKQVFVKAKGQHFEHSLFMISCIV